jgi:hypothetical protein
LIGGSGGRSTGTRQDGAGDRAVLSSFSDRIGLDALARADVSAVAALSACEHVKWYVDR